MLRLYVSRVIRRKSASWFLKIILLDVTAQPSNILICRNHGLNKTLVRQRSKLRLRCRLDRSSIGILQVTYMNNVLGHLCSQDDRSKTTIMRVSVVAALGLNRKTRREGHITFHVDRSANTARPLDGTFNYRPICVDALTKPTPYKTTAN